MNDQRGPRLLIVDDNAIMLRAIVRVVRSRSISHLAIGSVGVALDAIEVGPYLAVLTDLDLGEELTGLDVLAAFRARWPDAKRVLMSGSPAESVDVANVWGLAHRVIRKPFRDGELGEVLDWITM